MPLIKEESMDCLVGNLRGTQAPTTTSTAGRCPRVGKLGDMNCGDAETTSQAAVQVVLLVLILLGQPPSGH